MAELTVNTISGVTAENMALTAAAAAGDKYAMENGVFIVAHNAHGTDPRTITIDAVKACNQGFEHDITVTIPAGETWISPRISPYVYGDATGYVNITYSDAGADITINPFKQA